MVKAIYFNIQVQNETDVNIYTVDWEYLLLLLFIIIEVYPRGPTFHGTEEAAEGGGRVGNNSRSGRRAAHMVIHFSIPYKQIDKIHIAILIKDLDCLHVV